MCAKIRTLPGHDLSDVISLGYGKAQVPKLGDLFPALLQALPPSSRSFLSAFHVHGKERLAELFLRDYISLGIFHSSR